MKKSRLFQLDLPRRLTVRMSFSVDSRSFTVMLGRWQRGTFQIYVTAQADIAETYVDYDGFFCLAPSLMVGSASFEMPEKQLDRAFSFIACCDAGAFPA